MLTVDQILSLKNQALAIISQTNDPKDLEQLRQEYLSRKGQINQLLKKIVKLNPVEKQNLGRVLNETKIAIDQATSYKLQATSHKLDWLDTTQPGQPLPLGHLHPISQAIDEITRIFEHIGFTRVRYPEVDWDWYVFESLNMPPNHPARDEWETFFVKAPLHRQFGQMVLTTHTSNGQVREM